MFMGMTDYWNVEAAIKRVAKSLPYDFVVTEFSCAHCKADDKLQIKPGVKQADIEAWGFRHDQCAGLAEDEKTARTLGATISY